METSDFARGAALNLLILPAFVILCGAARAWTERRGHRVPPWEMGFLYGFMAVIAMLFPVVTPLGEIFDCRSGVIGMIALIGGPSAALASLPLPMLYRFYFGGFGMVPGLLELVFPAVIGSVCNLAVRQRRRALTFPQVLVCSLLVSVISNGSILALVMVFLPQSAAGLGLAGVVLIILNTFISMSLLSGLVLLEQEHFKAMESVAESERRMRHSQKMAAIGQLSGKVAHSFLNALTAILGNAREAKEKIADNPEALKFIDRTIAAAERISPMTAQLLAFANPGPLNQRRMDVSRCLAGIRRILAETIGPEVEVVIRADEAAGKADIDPELIEQAIIHLAVNAAEAMSGHGRLTISVSRAELSRSDIAKLQADKHPKERHEGEFAVISVEDTGCGMPEEVTSRIFEPFFTTKDDRKNAGLGLATVYKIVKLHNGHIDVRSRPGEGTTFLIYLPVFDEAP